MFLRKAYHHLWEQIPSKTLQPTPISARVVATMLALGPGFWHQKHDKIIYMYTMYTLTYHKQWSIIRRWVDKMWRFLLFRLLLDSRWKSWIVPTYTSALCLPITCMMWRIMLTTDFSETTLGLVLIGNEPNSQCSFWQPESNMSRPRIFAVFRKLALTCVWKLRAAWPRGECQQNSHGSLVCSGWFDSLMQISPSRQQINNVTRSLALHRKATVSLGALITQLAMSCTWTLKDRVSKCPFLARLHSTGNFRSRL